MEVVDKGKKMKYYSLIVDNEIRLVIPWGGKEPPTPIEFCQAISSVWAKSGPDFSFGKTPDIEQFFGETYVPRAENYAEYRENRKIK